MKTIRFSQVVEACGKPHLHLLLIDPKKDDALQRAIKTHRVMTVHQSPGGTKADFGTIGFEVRPGQILIFPKTLKRFANRRVVGIDFGLVAETPGERSARHLPARVDGESQRSKRVRAAVPTKLTSS